MLPVRSWLEHSRSSGHGGALAPAPRDAQRDVPADPAEKPEDGAGGQAEPLSLEDDPEPAARARVRGPEDRVQEQRGDAARDEPAQRAPAHEPPARPPAAPPAHERDPADADEEPRDQADGAVGDGVPPPVLERVEQVRQLAERAADAGA